MPDDVRAALNYVIQHEGNKTEVEADAYIRELDRKRRYQGETWS